MTFPEVLAECVKNAAFVHHWARLRNVNLAATPIERMVDEATGANEATANLFIDDVYNLVWCRIPRSGQ